MARRGTRGRRRALVVDDAEGMRTFLAHLLEQRGWDVDTAEDGRRALALMEGGAAPDVVILDVMMDGLDGLQTLERIRKSEPKLPVVMLSVSGKASTIVDAMRLGAADYLTKPFEEDELEATLENVLERQALLTERDRLAAEFDTPDGIVWASPAMRRVRDLLEHVADTDVTVLIQGESGAGKEVVARTLHGVSSRARQNFVKVNCAALPTDLLESELFGYEKGAFTGATHRKQGKFELAHRGTIFLDEVGDMSLRTQAKVLRVLQEGEVERIGSQKTIQVDVRVIAATNKNLEEEIEEGRFREEL